MRLLFFGTYDAAAHPRVAVLRDGLRAHGDDVRECNEPLGLSTAQRVGMLRNPAALPLLGWRLARCWWALWRRSRPYRRQLDRLRRTRSSSATSATSTCCSPGGSSRTCPIVLDHLVGASDTARDRGVGGRPAAAAAARPGRRRAAPRPTWWSSTPRSTGRRCRTRGPAAGRRRRRRGAPGVVRRAAARPGPPAARDDAAARGLLRPLHAAAGRAGHRRGAGRARGRRRSRSRWSAPGRTWPRPAGWPRPTTG